MAKSYRKFIAGAATAAVVASSFAGVAGAASNYTDVASQYQEAVDFVVSKGIKGTSATTFGTYENIKRVDAAVFVASVLGLDTNSAPASGFTDVPDRAKGAVNALKAAGITSGKTSDSFGAYDNITRGELAIWIQRGFELKTSYQSLAFNDVSERYAGAVSALVSNGITNGTSAITFGTYDHAKRGDFAIFLQRAYDVLHGDDDQQDIPDDILTITSDTGNSLVNGSKKVYKVKLVNPVSGKPVEGAVLNVTFEENLDTDFGPQRKVTVTDSLTGSVIPYQSTDGEEAVAKIKTDKNGVATFTLTGTNASVTPIVFLDGSYQEWDTEGGILPKTQDGRFDSETELYEVAETVTFGGQKYTIAVDGQGDNYAAVTETQYAENPVQPATGYAEYINGREYVITVKDADGKAYAGGVVNVGINELLDGKLGNEPVGAYIADHKDNVNPLKLQSVKTKDGRTIQGTIKLDANGQAKIILASTKANDSAEPIVWIDQNWDNNEVNNVLEDGEPVSDASKVNPTNFQPAYVDGAKLKEVDLTADARRSQYKGLENREDVKGFQFYFLNQSGTEYLPPSVNFWDGVDAQVTYEIVNTGPFPVKVHTANALTKLSLHNAVGADYISENGIEHAAIQIEVGGRVTIKGNVTGADWYKFNSTLIAAYAKGGNSSVRVSASAIVDGLAYDGYYGDPDGYNENQSVSVSAGPITANLADSLDIKDSSINITKAELKDVDNNGGNDQIVLTFDRPVTGVEAGDFRANATVHNNAATTATLSSDGKKLTLEFNESVLGTGNSAVVNYDRNYSGTLALTDLFGSKIVAFNVTATK